MIQKLINLLYNGLVPFNLGDRYYAQDMIRDFQYFRDRIGLVGKDISGTLPFIISGGEVSKGVGDTLNITACIGYAKFSVEIPDTFAAFPPSKISADIESIRIESSGQTNMSLPEAVLDNVTTNYIKLRYKETAGNIRNRARAVGSYNYEYIPDFEFKVNPTAPTSYDIVLGEFISIVGAVPATFTLTNRTYEIDLNKITRVLYKTSNYSITSYDWYTYYEGDSTSGNVIYTLPPLNLSYGKTIRIIHGIQSGSNILRINRYGSDVITKDSITSFVLPKQNDYIELYGSQSCNCWLITNERIQSQLVLNTCAGHGSVDTCIMRFTNLVEFYGEMFQENHVSGYSANTKGLEITINKSGRYEFSFSFSRTSTLYGGLSLNSNQLSTTIRNITVSHKRAVDTADTGAELGSCSWSGWLNKNNIIRAHTNGVVVDITDNCLFTATYKG
jgi:hypothetical protein